MSTHAHTRFEEGNSPYVAGFKEKGKLAIPPAKHLAIGPFIYDMAQNLLVLGEKRRISALRLTWPPSDLYGCPY